MRPIGVLAAGTCVAALAFAWWCGAPAALAAPAAPGVFAPGDRAAEQPLPAGAIMRFGSARLYHGAYVKGLAFSPDGRLLASAGGQYSQPGDIILWDVATGRVVRSLTGSAPGTACVAFSADGRTLAAAGVNRTVRFYDVATGKATTRLKAGSTRANWLALSPDGTTLGVSDGSNVRLIDTTRGNVVRTLGRGSCCVFSPDGQRVAVTKQHDVKTGVRIWHVATGKEIGHLKTTGQRLTRAAFSPDGRLVAAGCSHGTDRGAVLIWQADSGRLLRKLTSRSTYVYSLRFSPDGRHLAAACRGPGAVLWDLAAGKAPRDLLAGNGTGYAVAFSPDGKLVAAGGATGQIVLCATRTLEPRYADRGHRGPVTAVAAAPDRTRVFTGGYGGAVWTWDARTGRRVRRLTGDDAPVAALAVSDDGKVLARGGSDGTVRLYGADDGRPLRAVKPPVGACLALAFLPEGGKLLVVGPAGAVSAVDVATGGLQDLRKGGALGFSAVAMSADRTLAASYNRGVAYVWPVRGDGPAGMFSTTGISSFYGIALGPFGRLLACDVRQQLVLFEVDSGQKLRQIPLDPRRSASGKLAISPDGLILAAGQRDGTIGFWSALTGKSLGQRKGHRGQIASLTFLPAGPAALSGGADGTAILWSLKGLKPALPTGPGTLDADDLRRLWAKLASSDAEEAQQAIFGLAGGGKAAVTFVGENLRLAATPSSEDLQKLIADLDHREFAVRDRATRQLARLGPMAETTLRRALTDSASEEVRARARRLLDALDDPHQRSGQALRHLRAVHVLERIASAAAVAHLRKLAAGAAAANLTRRAQAALNRLTRR